MLWFIVSPIVAVPVAPPEEQARAVDRQAAAAVRIQRPAPAGRAEWERLPKAARREVIVRGEEGEPVLLRLIEHE
jgi:hypothetical protein